MAGLGLIVYSTARVAGSIVLNIARREVGSSFVGQFRSRLGVAKAEAEGVPAPVGRLLDETVEAPISQGLNKDLYSNLPEDHMWTHASPFQNKSAKELNDMFIKKGYDPKGLDPINGKGSYINTTNGRQYRIDPSSQGRYREPNHVDITRSKDYTGPLDKKRFVYKQD